MENDELVLNGNYVLALDVSTTTIGIALFEDFGDKGELKFMTHVSPKVKPQPASKMEELFKKVELFENEFLFKYKKIGITHVVIEEPLLQSNNIYTVATLIRFNGMISKSVYDTIGVVPEFISSYEARKYGYPDLMGKRKVKKDGTPLPEKQIAKNEPVLFGDYPFDVDKKMVVWEKVADECPSIVWFYDKKNKLVKESFDCSDAYVAGVAYMNKINKWKR